MNILVLACNIYINFTLLLSSYDDSALFSVAEDDDTAKVAFATAMKEGGGKMKPCNITLHGPPGAGKTSLKRLILGLPPLPKDEENSTNIMEKAVRAVDRNPLTSDGKKLLEAVDNDELTKMIARFVGIYIIRQKLQNEPDQDSNQQPIIVSVVSIPCIA